MASITDILSKLNAQDFGRNDSTIVSSIRHPIKAAGLAGRWFQDQVNNAAWTSIPYDEANPFYTPDSRRQEAAFNLAVMANLGSMPFATKSAGGTLGTVIKPTIYDEAHEIARINASKPISEGGLGLPENNTAMDRASALGFNTPAYHGTTAGTYIPDEVQALISDHRKKMYSLETLLQDKYGKDERGYRTYLWKDDPITIEQDNIYNTIKDLESKNNFIQNPDIGDEFNPHLSRDIGSHFAEDPYVTNQFNENGVTYPVLIKDPQFEVDDIFSRHRGLTEALDNLFDNGVIDEKLYNKFIDRADRLDNKAVSDREWGSLKPVSSFWNSLNKSLIKQKTKNISYVNEVEGGGDSYVVMDPTQVRSITAAFDPMKRNSANLLASVIGGTALANEYDKKKRKPSITDKMKGDK